MPFKQAPRVAVNLFAKLVLKVFLCTLIFPTLLSLTANAAANLRGTDIRDVADFSIMVAPTQLPVATVSTPYLAALNVQGGTAPYQFKFERGVLPPGLYFNNTTGTVGGTPTTAGTYNFRLVITDRPNTDLGEVTVYITVANGSGAPAVGVTVTPSSASVTSTGTLQLSAHVTNATNTSVTWSAQGGTISSSGLFTAQSVASASTATVTATSVADPTKTAHATITVNPAPVVAVVLTPLTSSLLSGARQQFVATVSNTPNTAVTWSANAGTISSAGMFTAPTVSSATTATVTATSAADSTKHAQSTVSVSPAVSISVAVSPSSSSLSSGGSLHFAATVSNTSNTSVVWSANPGTITSAGMFTAPSVSSTTSATITATSMADATKTAHSVVTINPMGTITVGISPVSATVPSAGTQQFVATVINTSNTAVSWTASSGSISGSGLFTAPSVSSATTATIRAISVADTTKMALATVQISPVTQGPPPPPPPPPPTTGADNTYCGTGDVANFGGNDTVAALPQACLNTALASTPTPGRVTLVAAGGSIQTAINAAACGDTIQIQAGASFTGTFSLPNKSCDSQHWIIIRTSAPDSSLPAEGTRLTPCYAGVASLPDRPPYYCPSAADVMPKILAAGNQAFTTQPGASYYRFIGLEITHGPNMQAMQPDTLVSFTSAAPLPNHIIIDRCWIHGLPTAFLKRGIKLDGSYLAVIDSTITDVHAVGTATQGMLSGTGTGPLKIVNNFVEGGDSAVGFGGQGNPFGNPTDVEIRRNHLFKPWSWQYGSPTYLGYAFSAKVALESKNSNRVLIEGNIMEHAWGDAGSGGAVQGGDGSIAWLGPKNQSSVCPTCDVSDITFRYNLIRHAGAGPYIFDAPSDTGALAVQAKRYSIHDNLLDDISTAYSRNGSGNGMLHRFYGTSAYQPPRDVSVFHNTGLASGLGFLSFGGTSAAYVNFSFTNNLEIDGMYGISGCASLFGTAALTACAPGYNFTGNVIIGGRTNILAGAIEPASATTVGFANFNNGNGGDYRLCLGPGNPVASCTAASPYINAGTDGRDIGADLTTLNTMISGVN